jgi:cytochrome b6-f complex iron-sulfur subunit
MLVTAEPTLGPDRTRSRRQVLCGLAMALVAPGVVVAACSTDDGADAKTPGRTTGAASTSSGNEPEGAIVRVKDVPVGGGVLSLAGGRQVLVVQPKAGTVEAFDPICPHQGFSVNPPVNGTITCPGHGSTFDAVTGALKGGPSPRGLTKVPVKISKGYVIMA